jgi:hypothetical protein
MAESQSSEQTIMAIAGHVSREMLGHYSHIRHEAKWKAVGELTNVTTKSQLGRWKAEAEEREKAKRHVQEDENGSALADDFRTLLLEAV